jgi:hypothetical protein
MAQPQGLNIPAIITTGIVTLLSTAAFIEGVRAVYAYEEPQEEARKWNTVTKTTAQRLRDEQLDNLHKNTTVSIDSAMEKVVATGGKTSTK